MVLGPCCGTRFRHLPPASSSRTETDPLRDTPANLGSLVMANPNKSKGDRAEREAVTWLVENAADLVYPEARRYLGAGRQEDEGDLWVLPDAAIQVKHWKKERLGQALRVAALDSVRQAKRSRMRFPVGMVKYPNSRTDQVRWLASWVADADPNVSTNLAPVEFKLVSRTVAWVRDDDGPYGYVARPRTERIAVLSSPKPGVYVAPFEAWLTLYRAGTAAAANDRAA